MLSSEYEKEPITNYFYNFFKEGSAHAIYVVVAVVVYTKHFSNWTPFLFRIIGIFEHGFVTLRTFF